MEIINTEMVVVSKCWVNNEISQSSDFFLIGIYSIQV